MHTQLINRALVALIPAAVLAVGPANAEDDRWYATGNLGLGNLSSTTLTYADGTGSSTSFSTDFDASFVGGGTVGYHLSDKISIAGEITYRRNEFDGASLAGLGTFSGGDFASLGFGVSALYRFPIGQSGRLSGYIGPGYLYLQEIDIDFDADGAQEVSFESDDGGFQIKLGGRYDMTDRWFVEAGATYFAGGDVTLELPADSSETIAADYDHWTMSIGAGIRFW